MTLTQDPDADTLYVKLRDTELANTKELRWTQETGQVAKRESYS